MIPERFLERMKGMLGEDFAAFERALGEPSVRAVRVNTVKLTVGDFLEKTELDLSPIPYAEDGFIPSNTKGIGKTAEHHAGMFYVQDPGAMATVKALDIQRGWRVLDSCAAPGGKASQLAAAIGEDGFLLANEYVPKRAKIIVGNFERLGIKNAAVTSLDTKAQDVSEELYDLESSIKTLEKKRDTLKSMLDTVDSSDDDFNEESSGEPANHASPPAADPPVPNMAHTEM